MSPDELQGQLVQEEHSRFGYCRKREKGIARKTAKTRVDTSVVLDDERHGSKKGKQSTNSL